MPSYTVDINGQKFKVFADTEEDLKRAGTALKLTVDLRARTEAAEQGADIRAEAPSTEPGFFGQAANRAGDITKGLGDMFVRMIAPQPSPEIAADRAAALRQIFADKGPLAGLTGLASQAGENALGTALTRPEVGLDIGKGLVGAQMEQLLKAGEAYRAGTAADTMNLEAPLRAIAGVTPVVGPMAANFVDDLRGGNYGGAAVDAGLAALPFARQINAGVAGAAGRIGKIGAGAGGKTAAIASAVGRNPIARMFSPYRSRELRLLAKERLPAAAAPTGDEILIKQLMDGKSDLGKMSRESAEALVKRSKEGATTGGGGTSVPTPKAGAPSKATTQVLNQIRAQKEAAGLEVSDSMSKLIREQAKKSKEPPAGLSAAETKLWREAAGGKPKTAGASTGAGEISSGRFAGKTTKSVDPDRVKGDLDWKMRTGGKESQSLGGRMNPDTKEMTMHTVTTKMKDATGKLAGPSGEEAAKELINFARAQGMKKITFTNKEGAGGYGVSKGGSKFRTRFEKMDGVKATRNPDGTMTLELGDTAKKTAAKPAGKSIEQQFAKKKETVGKAIDLDLADDGLDIGDLATGGKTIEQLFKETQSRKLKLDIGKPAPKFPSGPHPGKGKVKTATTYGEKRAGGINTRGVLTGGAEAKPIPGTEKMSLERLLLESIKRAKAEKLRLKKLKEK